MGAARVMLVPAAIAVILAGCATAPKAPPGSEAVRAKLTMLKSEPQLAARVPVIVEQAERAVVLAETPQGDPEVAAHRVYLADRTVDTARAIAQTRLAEEQRDGLKQQSDDARLAARTREADAATRAAAVARSDAASSRMEAETATAAAVLADAQKQELARQIALLQAEATERGIVLTLGDVLFATGSDQLKPGATGNLDRLVSFMAMYGDRSATIEGHTDNVGEDAYNQGLSQRRADGVKAYLASRGVAAARLTSMGMGEAYPIAGNESAGGRQQNRRVEVIIGSEVQ
jgi:outer membrane protein OmpA-like peptidoglycan-associated protein